MNDPVPSPADALLAERLAILKAEVYAMRVALQAIIAATPCSSRTLAAFDDAASRLLASLGTDNALHPLQADREAQRFLQQRLSGWREFLSPPGTPGAS